MSKPVSTPGMGIPKNAIGINMEDYFQVAALADRFPREAWA